MRSEFEFINHIKKTHGLGSIGDDCAVLPFDSASDLVITVDMLAEDIDFRLEWTDPISLGHKALAVSLSDIAAMGAEPMWALLSIGAAESIWDSEFLDAFYAGWHRLADEFDLKLVGGDVSKLHSGLVVDSIAAGKTSAGKAVLRSGARPGDAIFVSGKLGGAAAGLHLLEDNDLRTGRNDELIARCIDRQLRPVPRVEAGRFLAESQIATSMIDISDGLAADLGHICEASGVGARLEVVPLDTDLLSLFDTNQCAEFALHGGEDLELLFTSDEVNADRLANDGFVRIGTISDERGSIVLNLPEGQVPLPAKGYQHFS